MFFIWFQWIVKNYIYNEEQIFPSLHLKYFWKSEKQF